MLALTATRLLVPISFASSSRERAPIILHRLHFLCVGLSFFLRLAVKQTRDQPLSITCYSISGFYSSLITAWPRLFCVLR